MVSVSHRPPPRKSLIPTVLIAPAVGWAEGNAQGRPVGLAVDKAGALLVADDVGNAVWRVTPR